MAFAPVAKAQDAGIFELHVRKPWTLSADKRAACIMQAELSQNHAFEVAFDGESKTVSLLVKTDQDQFIVNRLYQTDIYIDFNTHFENKAVPLSPRDIQLVNMDIRRFDKLFDGIEEISFGLDDTLYVVNFSNIPFPFARFQECTAPKLPQDQGILDTISGLNPFALPEDDAPTSPLAHVPADDTDNQNQPAAAMQAQNMANTHAADQPKQWQPFLTSYRPQPYALKNAPDVSLQDVDKAVDPMQLDGQKDNAPGNPDYQEIIEFNEARAQQPQSQASCGAGVDGVYEFSQIPEAELPPQMQGLRDFMTGNDNNNEEKELIRSLLVQMELLEKEKEALRRRAPEQLEPLAVIRSCVREEEAITDLQAQLEESENEKFDLMKQYEIQGDIINAYEQIEGDIPAPDAPKDDDTLGESGE